MEAESNKCTGARMLSPPFMEIRQAMAIVKGRPNAAAHLKDFISRMAKQGIVGDILERHGLSRDCAMGG